MTTNDRTLRKLTGISQIPEANAGEWLSSAEKSIEFLKENVQSDRLVLFVSMPCVLIHVVLAPLRNLNPPDQDDLSHDFVALDDAWGIEHESGGGRADRVYLAPPLSRYKTLKGGEKLYFSRSFAGSRRRSLEISQRLVHALNLHFIEERNAYCRLDDDGDLEDVICITEKDDKSLFEHLTLITISMKDFVEYMRLDKMGMVIFFDFTRLDRRSFNGWSNRGTFSRKAPDLFYDGEVVPGRASYVNGRMIARPAITMKQIVKARKKALDPASRQYATFKAIDLVTGQKIEISCDPKGLSNYFQADSLLPREMSFAFFKADVLHKYKADSEKYDLQDRSIRCRGTWGLQTYDVNEAGQVHTYLRYLAQLPYREQVYWQSFNEWPKAPLSQRAVATDFKGEFYTEYDPLNSLKRKLHALDKAPPAWWTRRGEELFKAVHYPVTTAPAEWANEILALDQLLVEGFKVRALRDLARHLGRSVDPNWASLKLVEESLIGAGVDQEDARNSLEPLRTLHELRTVLKGHAAIERKRTLEKQALKAFGSFRVHYADLAAGCDAALDAIASKLGGA
ncbi:MAG: hypothetical protein JO328_16440 [Hyphomicrobiales bacterium]|nr:hypothetical protein [Hyphomicrobiales bacterium]MBV8823471.1 hypothetical protein [Hyphomicrobiales bacterium]